jgi:hypothetical protein
MVCFYGVAVLLGLFGEMCFNLERNHYLRYSKTLNNGWMMSNVTPSGFSALRLNHLL